PARPLARQRQERARQRARAEARLAAAEHELKKLGRRGRRTRGIELRAEIALQRAALDLAEERAARLELPGVRQLLAPAREVDGLSRARVGYRRLERHPPGLELER